MQKAPGQGVDLAAVEPLLRELQMLISQSSFRTTEKLAQIEQLLQGTDYARQFAYVVKATDDYDFEHAEEALRELAAMLTIADF
jgi:hypothetical protein